MTRLVSAALPQVSDVLAQLTQQDDLVAAAQALGFTVRLRDCVGGGAGAQCLHNLRHSFLILSPSAHSTSSRSAHREEIIIDPTFKESFIIAHPSARYTAALEALPPVFIGTLRTVQPLVELLCAEMALAFKEAGIVMPPWRSLRSMMTKWMPRRSLDLPLPAAAPAARTAGPAAPPGATASHAHASTIAGLGQSAAGMASTAAPRVQDNSRLLRSSRLLRQACHAADHTHSSLGPSSAASAIHSASSSNCSSSSSAGAPHAALLRAAAGFESETNSPVVHAAAALTSTAAAAPPTVPREVERVVANHANHAGAKQAAHKRAAGTSAVPQVVKCLEPLQRVVGGFGASFGFTPTLL